MLEIIVYTMLISLVSNIVLKKINLPTIIGYIFTGIIIAYGFHLHDAVHNHELKEIAEFGVVFLMFTIGLEFSVSHLKRMKNEVFVAGSAQILVTVAISYLVSHYLLNLEHVHSIVISLAVALSSTAIVLKTYNDTGEINTRYGQRALGILIMQDIAVIPILLLLGFLASKDQSISYIVFKTFVDGILLIAILIIIGKYILEPFFTQIVKTKSDELFVTTILFMAIASSFLAHEMGFSYSLGAFIAGMLISETKYKYQAEADLIPFRDLLLGIFFITVGMQINFEIIGKYLAIVALLILSVLTLKFLIIYTIIRINENARTSLITALSLVQIGEFSLAILELARSSSLIGPPYGQIMIVVIVISMIMTPILLKNLNKIADKFSLEKQSDSDKSVSIDENRQEHVVMIGYGEFGQEIVHALKQVDKPYIIIENDIQRYNDAKKHNEAIIFGNALKKEVLKNAAIKDADNVVIAINDVHKLRQLCEKIAHYIDKSQIVVKVHSHREKKLIEDLDLGYVIVENDLIGKAGAKIVLGQTKVNLYGD